MRKLNILFHTPIALLESQDSGDFIRPNMMYKAFLSQEHNVFLCHGNVNKRRLTLQELKNNNIKIDLIYSELSSRPIYTVDKRNIIKSFFTDFYYFYLFKKKGAKIGLYYRDMHWVYPGTSKPKGFVKRFLNIGLHLVELIQIKSVADILFVPSTEMLSKLPSVFFPKNKIALPPGCIERKIKEIYHENDELLRCFYVGGCTPPLYDLLYIFKAAEHMPDVEFNFSLRKKEWLTVKNLYGDIPSNAKVFHLEGEEMLSFLESCDLQLILYPETEYRNIALPVKIFESVACNVPVIVFNHGLTAQLVKKEIIGWVVNDFNELVIQLQHIKDDRSLLNQKQIYCQKYSISNTWKKKASFVISNLS